MTKLLEIYKCSVCGNMVEVVHASVGELVCCNKPMLLLKENTEDAATEKHVPIIKENYVIEVGSTPHPMEEKHYIEWIELIFGNKAYRAFLKPGKTPSADFKFSKEKIKAREYCNIHGLWSSEEK